ncbi:MAG: HAD-IC family P-type ATPase [Pseudomonadota bacterium]
MTAREFFYQGRHFVASGEGYAGEGTISAQDGSQLPDFSSLLTPAALCNESSIRDGKLIGDPTEGALLALAGKGGEPCERSVTSLAPGSPRIAEIPFDSAHKFMATFYRHGGQVRMLVKGAPDVLLARAGRLLGPDGDARQLEAPDRIAFETENARLAGQAMRVLAIAQRDISLSDFNPAADLMPWAQQLTLVGLVGLIDPPRPEARDAIDLCKQAGIRVKMITGDHALTASAIARELGLHGTVLTGAELEGMDVAELSRRIEDADVFARVAPEHKVKIVQALKARGHVVAMTGDGVNDAPALKNADIGIAMGITGTEVTKEAAAMVLADDNFASIVGAVKEGRTIYDNIVKFVRFQLSTSVGAILTVVGAQLLGLPMPFTAIHILWIALIMDGPPAVMLGLEPTRSGIMNEPPRHSGVRILTLRRLGRLLTYGSTMATGTIGVYLHGLEGGEQTYASTLAFTTFVLFQFFNVMNARFDTGTAFNRQLFDNRKLWLALAAVLVLQMVVVNWAPAQAIFDTASLNAGDWLLATGIASSVLLLDEARKFAGLCWRAMGNRQPSGRAGDGR